MGPGAQQIVCGNIGSVYDLRTIAGDRAVIDFSVAVTPRRKDGDEWVDGETYWVNCTAWNRLAENIAESFEKGDRVLLVGKISMKDGYTNKDGEEVPARPQLVVDYAGLEVSLATASSDRKKSSGSSSSSRKPKQKEAVVEDDVEEDIFADDDFDFDNDESPF